MLWAQRPAMLYLRVVVPEGLDPASVAFRLNDTHVGVEARAAGPAGAAYAVDLALFRRIEAQTAAWDVRQREIQLTLEKKWEWRYWPRLLRDPGDPLKPFVGIDWKKWKEEEDDDEGDEFLTPLQRARRAEDDDWADSDLAVKKPAHFPEEEYYDARVPLLNATSFRGHVQGRDLTAVLFFSRAKGDKASLLMHKMFARVAPAVANVTDGRVALARVDTRAGSAFLKKLHVVQAPAGKIFFRDGGMFDFDVRQFQNPRNFMGYLVRQLLPAHYNFSGAEAFLDFVARTPRLALAVAAEDLPAGKAEKAAAKAFDLAAKTFRAAPLPPLVTFVRANHSLLAAVAGLPPSAALEEATERLALGQVGANNFTGVVVGKTGEPPAFYAGKWRKRPLVKWLLEVQHNLIERITPLNFGELRAKKKPILYLVLEQANATHARTLADFRPLAAELEPNITFVHTVQNATGTDELLDHLRCDNHGARCAGAGGPPAAPPARARPPSDAPTHTDSAAPRAATPSWRTSRRTTGTAWRARPWTA